MVKAAGLALGVAVVLAACGSGPKRRVDPPVLVPWHTVGNISLGETRADVVRDYGAVGHGYHLEYVYNGLAAGYYRLHGSRMYVSYRDGVVNDISFSTRYYRTSAGFGVGSRIPLGPCLETPGRFYDTYPCLHHWHGFLYNLHLREDACSCWVKVGTGPQTPFDFAKPWTIIFVSKGRVSDIVLSRYYVLSRYFVD